MHSAAAAAAAGRLQQLRWPQLHTGASKGVKKPPGNQTQERFDGMGWGGGDDHENDSASQEEDIGPVAFEI